MYVEVHAGASHTKLDAAALYWPEEPMTAVRTDPSSTLSVTVKDPLCGLDPSVACAKYAGHGPRPVSAKPSTPVAAFATTQ